MATVTLPAFPAGPTLFPPYVGVSTVASGDESNPTYVIKTVHMDGSVISTLTYANLETITYTLNAPDEMRFHFAKADYTTSDLIAIGSGSSNQVEVQVYRNGDLIFWGPIVGIDGKGSDGKVTCTCYGVDWYLNRRFVDGIVTNLITNNSFESNTTGWTNVGIDTVSIDTNNFQTGAASVKFIESTSGDNYLTTSVNVGGNGVGQWLTLSGWFFIDSITAPAKQTRALYMEGFNNGVFQWNNWYPIDTATPQKVWTKAECTMWIPPNQAWEIHVALYAPQGTIHWDDIKLVQMLSVSTASITNSATQPVDIAQIAHLLVSHCQQSSVGKSPLHIGFSGATTGVKVAKTWQYVDHVQFDQAMKEFIFRGDGIDYQIAYTPTTRTFKTFAGKRGTDYTGVPVTLKYDPSDTMNTNCADYRYVADAGQCITRQTILGNDNGPDREQGEAADATHTGGTVLQSVLQAPQGTLVDSLQHLANEQIARYSKVPVTIEMDLRGDSGLFPQLREGDLVLVTINDGWVQESGVTMRIMKRVLDRQKNIMTCTVTVDTLSGS